MPDVASHDAGGGCAKLAVEGCLPLVQNNLNAAMLLETLEVRCA